MLRLKNKCPFYFLLFSFCFLLIITLSCCSNTGPQTGTLTGTIHLSGSADHSGIIIGIYELAELDPDIVAINQEYPHIGVIINQHTEFDHRFASLVKTAQTDASGSFEITNIQTGKYNFVAIKDSFGFRYVYNVQINEGDNDISNVEFLILNSKLNSKFKIQNSKLVSKSYFRNDADIILYPETIINQNINEPTTFESSHHYIIEDDIYVNAPLTIQAGAIIRLNEGFKITITNTSELIANGDIDNMIWFTKNDGFTSNLNEIIIDTTYIWKEVRLEENSDANVQWCKFDNANTGLLNYINGFEISDCIFRQSQCGFKAEDVDSTFCSNLLCEDIYNASEGGIYYSQVTDGLIEKNIVNDCENGIKIKEHSNPEIVKNFISNCNTGIDISYSSSPDVHNNEIDECEKSIYIYYGGHPNINRNAFQGNYGVCCVTTHIEMHNNNCHCSIYVIRLSIAYDWPGVDINAENNYFYTTNEDEIQELIYDKNDVEQSMQEHIGVVHYDPFLLQPASSAGISED